MALALLPGIGPKRLLEVLKAEDPLGFLRERFPEAWRHLPEAEAQAERERGRAEALGVRLLGLWEEGFPEGLRALPQPPTHLYLKGELPPEREAVALVGTRRASPWALAFARRLARELAEAGLWVVSGLARGIDREAHLGALGPGAHPGRLGKRPGPGLPPGKPPFGPTDGPPLRVPLRDRP